METMNIFFQIIFHSLQQLTAVDISLMSLNILLLLFSKAIFSRKFTHSAVKDDSFDVRLKLFRSVNLLIIALILVEDVFIPVAQHSWLTKIIAIPLIIYVVYLIFYLLRYLIRKRFGCSRKHNGTITISDTYNSRILSILTALFLTIFTLISIIQLMGFDSLLHAGGMIGFMGVMLALTQASWAPDIISGLIILNSEQLNDGDIIQLFENNSFDDNPIIGSVFKVKLFYTEILNLTNNHRIMLKNSKLRDCTIQNLSRFSSAKGLREELRFNIGYDVIEAQVVKMFAKVEKKVFDNRDIAVNEKYPMEIRATVAGDFAITWSLFYYTKEIQHILKTRQFVRSAVIAVAHQENITLATPILYSSAVNDVKIPLPPQKYKSS